MAPTLYRQVKSWLLGQLRATKGVAVHAYSTRAKGQIDHVDTHSVVPYDENLLERSRTQWQFGDWESLTRLERDTLQHHPDRAKLALLAAAGHLQQGNSQVARNFTRLAQDWGCSKKNIAQILVAGVHNSLGRAAVVIGQQGRALQHFERAIAIGTPGSAARLLTSARVSEQLAQLGLPSGALHISGTDTGQGDRNPHGLGSNLEPTFSIDS